MSFPILPQKVVQCISKVQNYIQISKFFKQCKVCWFSTMWRNSAHNVRPKPCRLSLWPIQFELWSSCGKAKSCFFSGNILGLEGKVDTTLANVDHLMSDSASNERKFDDLETTHVDIKSKFCILHELHWIYSFEILCS